MPRRRIWEGKACFTTHVVREHTPVFSAPAYFDLICRSLAWCRANRELRLYGYVIMPDHIHLLTSVSSPEILRHTLSSFRTYCARNLIEMLDLDGRQWAMSRIRHTMDSATFWEPEYHPVDASSAAFDQKLDYIHSNPVRRGFVARPEHWLYSSARNYYLGENWPLEIDRIEDVVTE